MYVFFNNSETKKQQEFFELILKSFRSQTNKLIRLILTFALFNNDIKEK